MSDEAASPPRTDEGEVTEVAPLGVSGNFIDRVSLVQSSSMSLVVTLATDSQKSYALPFVDWSLDGSDGDNLPFSALVSLDNAAFLISAMASNLEKACQELSTVVNETSMLEPTRMELTKKLLLQAQVHLGQANDALTSRK